MQTEDAKFKSMVVRHPFHRLLSCYKDKMEGARDDGYYNRHGREIIRRFREVDLAQQAVS